VALIQNANAQVSKVKIELTTCPSSEEALSNRQRSLTECMTYISASLKAPNDVLNESELLRDVWDPPGTFRNEDRIQSPTKGSGSSSAHTDPEATGGILTCEYTPGKVSSIVNYGKDDAVQVSVIGKWPMEIRNYGSGPRTRQIAGEMSNETLQQLSRALSGHVLHNTKNSADDIQDP
jgi:hypothetical protein